MLFHRIGALARASRSLPAVQKSIQEQQASAGAAKVGGAGPEWVTPDLLQKIAADPLLRKAFTDPKCATAMAAKAMVAQAAKAATATRATRSGASRSHPSPSR